MAAVKNPQAPLKQEAAPRSGTARHGEHGQELGDAPGALPSSINAQLSQLPRPEMGFSSFHLQQAEPAVPCHQAVSLMGRLQPQPATTTTVGARRLQ